MQRARSVTGPLRRAHPASGATWNVQVVRGKMSSQCLWHACRALSAGLLLMLLGAAMAVIGYYADFLSVDQEIRGNATVSVKDEARGFHLNNLSYVGPIVMGFGGFIVVAACVMTFEARDSAAKVTPARPTALPRPLPRRGPACAAPARLDTLGVYRLPHALPLPHSLPLVPLHRHRPLHVRITGEREKLKGKARFGSAPDLRSGSVRATLPVAALRRPLRRYALSVDEPPQSAVSASAAESECGSQSSLALDLHASGACAGVTLRVRDNTRRRPLARQQRLQDDTQLATPRGSTCHINNAEEAAKTPGAISNATIDTTRLSVESEVRASSAPPPTRISAQSSPLPSPTLTVITPLEPDNTYSTIERTEHQVYNPNKQEMEKQTNALRGKTQEEICALPREDVINIELMALNDNMDRIVEEDMEGQPQAPGNANQTDGEDGVAAGAEVTHGHEPGATATNRYRDVELTFLRILNTPVEVTAYPPLLELNTREEFTLERLQEELEIDVVSLLTFHRPTPIESMHMEQEAERQLEDSVHQQYVQATERPWDEVTELQPDESTHRQYVQATERPWGEVTERQSDESTHRQYVRATERPWGEVTEPQSDENTHRQYVQATERPWGEVIERQSDENTHRQYVQATERPWGEVTERQSDEITLGQYVRATERPWEEVTEPQSDESTHRQYVRATERPWEEVTEPQSDESTHRQYVRATERPWGEVIEPLTLETTEEQCEGATEKQPEEKTERQSEAATQQHTESVTETQNQRPNI